MSWSCVLETALVGDGGPTVEELSTICILDFSHKYVAYAVRILNGLIFACEV